MRKIDLCICVLLILSYGQSHFWGFEEDIVEPDSLFMEPGKRWETLGLKKTCSSGEDSFPIVVCIVNDAQAYVCHGGME